MRDTPGSSSRRGLVGTFTSAFAAGFGNRAAFIVIAALGVLVQRVAVAFGIDAIEAVDTIIQLIWRIFR